MLESHGSSEASLGSGAAPIDCLRAAEVAMQPVYRQTEDVKRLATLGLVWFVTGLGAVAGSILGNAAGKAGLFAGAVAGGAVLAYLSPWACARLGWIASRARRAASFGALLGFLVAAPIAATNLHTPVIPVFICSLAGVGALVGVGRGARETAR